MLSFILRKCPVMARHRTGRWVIGPGVARLSNTRVAGGAVAATAGATCPADAKPRRVAKAESHRMSIEGVELHWTEQGAGRPLIILHGLGDSQHSWRVVAAELGRGYRVYALDRPGCGLSARPDASYGLDGQARLVAAWLARLGLDDVDVIGHSYGGGMALWLLLYRASSVRRLALVAPGGLGSEVALLLRLAAVFGGLEAGAEKLMGPITRLLVRLCGRGLSAEDQRMLCTLNRHPGTARAFVRTLRDVIDWRGQRRHVMHRVHEVEQLPSIALFWGEKDRVIPLEHGRALCSQFRGCSFWQLADAGHFLHWEAPLQLAAALREYLDAPNLERTSVRQARSVLYRPAPKDGHLGWPALSPSRSG